MDRNEAGRLLSNGIGHLEDVRDLLDFMCEVSKGDAITNTPDTYIDAVNGLAKTNLPHMERIIEELKEIDGWFQAGEERE